MLETLPQRPRPKPKPNNKVGSQYVLIKTTQTQHTHETAKAIREAGTEVPSLPLEEAAP